MSIGETMRIFITICFIVFYGAAGFSLELEKAVEMLEAAGDFETAETVAFKLTQEKPELYHRIRFLDRYSRSEFFEIVYLQTWADVKDSGNTAKLQSFVKAAPFGEYALEALDRLFALYKTENTILGYQAYIEAFPNSPRAVDALQGIFRVAFERASKHADKLNSVKFFDEYIRTFPTSPQVEAANRKAGEMEYQAIEETLDKFSIGNLFSSKQGQKETIARKLYNEMRFWKRQNQLLISQRKYSLLQKNLFIDTEAYTEMMDREETIEFRKSVVAFQEQTTRNLEELNRLYQEESRRIVETIRREARLTRKAISEQGEKARQGMQYVASQISDLSYQKGRLADAVNEQTGRMEEEARRASYEQERMFERAQEEARRQSIQSRRCAEVLSKNRKYTLFSGCP